MHRAILWGSASVRRRRARCRTCSWSVTKRWVPKPRPSKDAVGKSAPCRSKKSSCISKPKSKPAPNPESQTLRPLLGSGESDFPEVLGGAMCTAAASDAAAVVSLWMLGHLRTRRFGVPRAALDGFGLAARDDDAGCTVRAAFDEHRVRRDAVIFYRRKTEGV